MSLGVVVLLVFVVGDLHVSIGSSQANKIDTLRVMLGFRDRPNRCLVVHFRSYAHMYMSFGCFYSLKLAENMIARVTDLKRSLRVCCGLGFLYMYMYMFKSFAHTNESKFQAERTVMSDRELPSFLSHPSRIANEHS